MEMNVRRSLKLFLKMVKENYHLELKKKKKNKYSSAIY